MATTGIATTHDLVLKLRDRGFSMYQESQMEELYGLTTENCWVPPLNKCLCASDILGMYDTLDKNFYDKYIDSMWSDEREYYLLPYIQSGLYNSIISEYSTYKNGTYKIGYNVFGIPSSYKDNQLVKYSDIDLIIEVKIKHSRIVDNINAPRNVIMCTEMPTEQEYYAFQTNGNWNRIELHWINDANLDTNGYYVTYYPLSQGLRIGNPKANSGLANAFPDLTQQTINCYWLDGNQYVGWTPKPAFVGNVYIGGYFLNGTL